jgi:anti-sigma regulatory factor (Ser/Thr protein kinase)
MIARLLTNRHCVEARRGGLMSVLASSNLVHQAFLYGSQEEFVAAMSPFVRDGLELGDTVFAATKRSNIDALREELADDGELVEFHDTSQWETRPYDRLQAFRSMVDELPSGGVLRAMGEPVWNGSRAAVRQWARYESLINLALADASMRFVCLYDSGELPDRILDYALRTHPEQVRDGSHVACPAYEPPEQFLPGIPPDPPQASPELPLEPAEFRHVVAGLALEAGLEPDRVPDFVLAAHEVAANAFRHGRPPVRAHVWASGEEIICRIADTGAGISDPLVGWVPPSSHAMGGWGLPIARQLCDVVEIFRSGAETIVSVHLTHHEPRRA